MRNLTKILINPSPTSSTMHQTIKFKFIKVQVKKLIKKLYDDGSQHEIEALPYSFARRDVQMQKMGENSQTDEELTIQHCMEQRLPPLPKLEYEEGDKNQDYNSLTDEELTKQYYMVQRLPPLPRLEYDEGDKDHYSKFFEVMFGDGKM